MIIFYGFSLNTAAFTTYAGLRYFLSIVIFDRIIGILSKTISDDCLDSRRYIGPEDKNPLQSMAFGSSISVVTLTYPLFNSTVTEIVRWGRNDH